MSGIAASLTLAAAAATRWDAVIVGAGPGGAAAAVRLARSGVRVLLIERTGMPRGKLCGCCLSPAAVAELRGLALPGGGPLERAVPLRRVRLAAGGSEACIDAEGGATLSRETLDTSLVAAAIDAGCGWLPETAAAAIAEEVDDEPLVRLHVRDRRAAAGLACRRLLLATGLGEHVRLLCGHAAGPHGRVGRGSRIGLGAVLPAGAAGPPPGELRMAVSARGYCGIVRLEDGRIDVAAAVDRGALAAAPPAAVLRGIVTDACGADVAAATLAGLDAALIRATPALTRATPLVVGRGRRVLRVGDAAGYVEPFTGEGMGWALASGRLAAESLVDPGTGSLLPAAVAAGRYERAHRRHFTGPHARCRRVAAGLRRPWLVGLAVRAARLAPWAARVAVPAMTGGHGSRLAGAVP